MTNNKKVTISGIFRSSEDLSEVIKKLEDMNISEDDISILMSEETKNNNFSIDTTTKAPETAIKGLAAGGLLGAVVGGLTMVGMVLLPGIGLVVAGPIIGSLAGLAAGSTVGSIIGALIGLGIPEHEAKFYENAIKERGTILLVTHVRNDIKNKVKELFENYGAHHIATER